ncbi:alkaline phosphatase, partial [Staphylococcus epidermidis]|uniref:alkaline phosphatase n=1 Tax=Staphylococcus epidermidis TaxID=1282 RepID=UPI001643691F
MGKRKNGKNVMLMVGDGMGGCFKSGYGYYKNKGGGKKMTGSGLDKYVKGRNGSYCNDRKENVRDCGGGGRGFSRGEKRYKGGISVDRNKKGIKCVVEEGKE